MIKRIGLYTIAIVLAILVSGCGSGKKALQIKGSDTMVNLGQAWAEEFMKVNPGLSVAVTGGGSGVGIASLINGTTDIAETSRDMEPKEIALAKKRGVQPNEIRVANDGITIIVNPANQVNRLNVKQLSDIYSGKIKNWKEVGGKDENIVVLSRDRNSGTHVFFSEHVVKMGDPKNTNEFAPSVLMMPSNQAIVEEVVANRSAIGYIGLGYLSSREKALAVSAGSGTSYVMPSIKTVTSKEYPIARSLQFYTNGDPVGEVKSFVDFVLSAEGQKIVLKMDFVPIK
ncbi:MAG: phosphate ABC transporter substrate-binding protein [Candidatus Margulisbacteria bacterium]|nr:phosphate ABC transporter substrate-binding protein [Candidatus Margulisiibacteriota bacterium]MBU1617037.1 phosphate ABC transporter substrate-binding protein [Candidatus Margulisiibacteriota bacterium]